MSFDDMQKAWQTQNAGAKMLIDAEALLHEVRRNQRGFRGTIFWRDFREVGVAAWLTWLFLHWGIRDKQWPLYFMSFTCFAVGLFMIVDRLIQRRRRPVLNDSLKACVAGSLMEVKHQIWLLNNVVWWYLLPLLTGIVCLSGNSAWQTIARGGARALSVVAMIGGYLVLCGLLYWGIYDLNQWAVRQSLDPRRKELETLLASLE